MNPREKAIEAINTAARKMEDAGCHGLARVILKLNLGKQHDQFVLRDICDRCGEITTRYSIQKDREAVRKVLDAWDACEAALKANDELIGRER